MLGRKIWLSVNLHKNVKTRVKCRMECFLDMGRGVTISFKGFDEMFFFNGKILRGINMNDMSNNGFKRKKTFEKDGGGIWHGGIY